MLGRGQGASLVAINRFRLAGMISARPQRSLSGLEPRTGVGVKLVSPFFSQGSEDK